VRHLWQVVRPIIRLAFLSVILLIVLGLTGRLTVFLYAIGVLIGRAFLWRRRARWIGPTFVIGFVLAVLPIDIVRTSDFPDGIWIRPISAGYLTGPVPRDNGVPEFWWQGCIIGFNDPQLMIVFGTGGSRKQMAADFRYQMEDFETQERIREAVDAAWDLEFSNGSFDLFDSYDEEFNDNESCVSLETVGKGSDFSIQGFHCESPHAFKAVWYDGRWEEGPVQKVEWTGMIRIRTGGRPYDGGR